GDGVAVGCCALADRQLKQIAVRIADITNHLKANPIRMNEVDEQQLTSFLNFPGRPRTTARDVMQNLHLSSWIIFSDYDSRIQIGSATDHGLSLCPTGAERRDAVAGQFGVVLSMSYWERSSE